MKTKFIVICILLTLWGGCKKEAPLYNSTVLTLIDLTDEVPPIPTGYQILQLTKMSVNPFGGAQIGVSAIMDIEHNKWELVTIESENPLYSNLTRRKLQVKAFEFKIDTILKSHIDTKLKHCGHSIIYKPIAETLTTLAKSTTTIRLLIISSNLYENSTVSYYSAHTLAMLKNKPERIIKVLEEEAPLPELTGIEIIFLYRPNSYIDNNNYGIVAGFYKKWFESRGAIVKIQSSL